MVHSLEVPLHLSRSGVQAHQRLSEQIGAGAPSAVVVAGRRRSRQVEQPASLVQRHRRPDVRMTAISPGAVLPRSRAWIFLRLRNYRKSPNAFPGPRVDGLDVAHRIGQLDAIGDLAADDE